MSPQNGRIACQIVKVVHDDSHEQIQHEKGAEEDEGDKIQVGHLRAACLVWVQGLACRLVVLVRPWVTGTACFTGKHDAGPGFACGAPESQERKVVGARNNVSMTTTFHKFFLLGDFRLAKPKLPAGKM